MNPPIDAMDGVARSITTGHPAPGQGRPPERSHIRKDTTLMARLLKLAAIAGMALALTAPTLVLAADHLDGPAVSANGAIDIADVYVFEGSDPANTVLSFTVNPAAGVISGTSFDPAAEYAILVDTDADAVEDITYTITFEAAAGGTQAFSVSRDGTEIATGTTGTTAEIGSGGMAWAGLVDDPFFFDLEGFQQLKATLLDAGTLEDAISLICDADPDTNFFAGFDASAIVIEVPDGDLGGEIGVWAETSVAGGQIDRKGKPGINTVFITGDDAKNGFNAAEPANDAAEYTDEVVGITSAIQQALGVAEMAANDYGSAVAGMLLADVLPFNTAEAADFSLFNGRALADDVIDVYYQVLTTVDGTPALTGDCVANDSTFQAEFPYYGVANTAPPSPAPMPNTASPAPTAGSGPIVLLAIVALASSAATLALAVRRAGRG
jgi:hypothetical protein